MTKQTGFLITATYFVPIDKKDFSKQAAAYATMAEIEKTGALPADFDGQLISVKAKQGAHTPTELPSATDEPDAVTKMQGDKVTERGGKPTE